MRRALVCGASQGIGRATAVLLAEQGHHVVLLARRREQLEALAHELRNATVCVADLDELDPSSIPRDVDIVVHNTGGPPSGALLEADASDILAALNRHLLTAHALVRHTLPHMRSRGFGRFVQVLSTSVYEPIPGLGVSNLTRAAVASWAKTLSRELPPGITINNVLPGFTDTPRLTTLFERIADQTGRTLDEVRTDKLAGVPEGRLAEASEVAAMVAFLVSEQGSYVRGQSIAVDGGRSRSI